MKFTTMFGFFVIFLFSCTTPETKIYNLSLLPMKQMAEVQSCASVNIVFHAPRYLEQPYIAYRIAPYEIRIANYSKWDSPPSDIVKKAIKDSLSSSGIFSAVRISSVTPPGFYQCEINLRRFERFDKGDDSFGELDFDISFLSPEGGILYRASMSQETKLADRSFSSLAMVLSDALSKDLEEVRIAIGESLP